MNRKSIAVVSASAFLGAALLPLPAVAADEQAVMRVSKSDLNLRSERDAQAMLKRIKTASARFCGDAYSPGAGQRRAARECQAAVAKRAVGALDAPMVTAMYQASERSAPVLLASR